jgi:UBX domain-containing protein 7
MDVSSEGRTYSERYQVHDYPHLAIIDPRTGRLLWRKEGWTQEKPLTADLFAEIAMDFCSRNSFDRPPTAPRPPTANGAAAARPSKRAMHEMSEDEQLQAAMRASLTDDNQDQEMVDDGDDDEVQIVEAPDAKPAAEEASNESESFLQDLQNFQVGDEPEKGARLQLRMPDGKRQVRKFSSTDTVKSIYAFLAVSPYVCWVYCSECCHKYHKLIVDPFISDSCAANC